MWDTSVYAFEPKCANIQDLADELQIPLLETSAKDGTNVEQAFLTMAALIRSKKIEQGCHITLGGQTSRP